MTQKKKLAPGDVIYADRTAYFHFGVYIGNNNVVNFKGAPGHERDPRTALIRLSSMDDFANGDKVYLDKVFPNPLPSDEVVARAISMINKDFDGYNLVSNNCEHFANWCKYGEKRSSQVENGVKRVVSFIEAFVDPIPSRRIDHLKDSFGMRKRDTEADV